jgi:hypothetical protein
MPYAKHIPIDLRNQFTQFGMRNITSEITTNSSFVITSSHVVQHSMEPYALEFSKNVQSCTVDSLTPGKPTVRVQDIFGGIWWSLTTQKNDNATDRTGKGLIYTSAHNFAQSSRTYYCEASGDYLNPNLTYPPYAPEKNPMSCGPSMDDYNPKNAQGDFLSLSMSYDNRTNKMTVHNHTWSCWDKDPLHKYVFLATQDA